MGTLRKSVMVACLLATSGCVDDSVSVFVAGNLGAEVGETGCVWDPGSGENLVRGQWDLTTSALGSGTYYVHLHLVNQLQRRGSTVRSETNGVFITRAEIELRGADGNALALPGLVNPFSIAVSGYVPPAADPVEPGRAALTVAAVPDAYRMALLGSEADNTVIVASIRLFGHTGGEIDIETGEWTWPIEVCQGCLLACLGEDGTTAISCDPGQDGDSQLGPASPRYLEFCP